MVSKIFNHFEHSNSYDLPPNSTRARVDFDFPFILVQSCRQKNTLGSLKCEENNEKAKRTQILI